MSKSSASILAIETCSETCSIALRYHGRDHQLVSNEPRGHAMNILPMIESLLNSNRVRLNELDAIAFTKGPGAFTGVRIGTSVAQGLSVASKVPLITISSLAVLAQGCVRRTNISRCIATLDARMSEVYLGFYQCDDSGLMVQQLLEQVAPPLKIVSEKEDLLFVKNWHITGPGWINYQRLLQQRFKNWNISGDEITYFPEAIDLLSLAERDYLEGRLIDATDALPTYIRDQVARKKQ